MHNNRVNRRKDTSFVLPAFLFSDKLTDRERRLVFLQNIKNSAFCIIKGTLHPRYSGAQYGRAVRINRTAVLYVLYNAWEKLYNPITYIPRAYSRSNASMNYSIRRQNIKLISRACQEPASNMELRKADEK